MTNERASIALAPGGGFATIVIFAVVCPLVGLVIAAADLGAKLLFGPALSPSLTSPLSDVALLLPMSGYLVMFAYLFGLPSALLAGVGTVMAAKHGRAHSRKGPALIGLSIGIAWVAKHWYTGRAGHSWASLLRDSAFLIVLHIAATLICWRLSRRWLKPAA